MEENGKLSKLNIKKIHLKEYTILLEPEDKDNSWPVWKVIYAKDQEAAEEKAKALGSVITVKCTENE